MVSETYPFVGIQTSCEHDVGLFVVLQKNLLTKLSLLGIFVLVYLYIITFSFHALPLKHVFVLFAFGNYILLYIIFLVI
jgi:hypothetical protein